MKKIIILTFFSTCSLFSLEREKIDLHIAYFGELFTHPGLVLGGEYPLIENHSHRLFLALNLGGYHHIRNNTSFFLSPELGYRFKFKSGIALDSNIGAGYMHDFLDGDIYKVIDNKLIKVENYGKPKFIPSISLGISYDLYKLIKKQISLFSKTTIFGVYPLDSFIIPHLSWVVGVRFKELFK